MTKLRLSITDSTEYLETVMDLVAKGPSTQMTESLINEVSARIFLTPKSSALVLIDIRRILRRDYMRARGI